MDDNAAAWIRLTELPGLGGAALRRLLARHGSPQAVLDAGAAGGAGLLDATQCATLARAHTLGEDALQRTRRWLDDASPERPRGLLSLDDLRYPAALLQTADPPLLLYWEGRLELLARRSLAIVGSRKPSGQGRLHAERFARALGDAGLCIVSGLAPGIDGAAHRGALDTAGGTIAVLGCGADQDYPPTHRALRAEIGRHGLLLSEYGLGTPPLPAHFPRRNRIIAGLSEGCLVVEAALRSGSLITARLASEAGREVFAIPGPIQSELARGCHELIRQGACLVQDPDEVLAELRPLARADAEHRSARDDKAAVALGADQQALLQHLSLEALTLDELQARSGWPTDRLSALLLDLELDGWVERQPGARFATLTRA